MSCTLKDLSPSHTRDSLASIDLEVSSKDAHGTWSASSATAARIGGRLELVIAIVCPGQGSQTPGMLTPWLELPGLADLLTGLSAAADLDLSAHGKTSDEDTIKDTAIAQPLLVASGLLSWRALMSDLDQGVNVSPDTILAGHSVGEITAAALTGVLTEAEAMSFVALRGRGMAEAASVTPTGMSAVLGGDQDEVLATIAAAGLTPANVNGAGQIVAAGTLDQLAAFAEAPPARARVIPLKVAGAFHTSHMGSAVEALASRADSLEASDPAYTLLSNRDGEAVSDGPKVLERLVAQVSSPVRWDLCMDTMAASGVTGLIELLPGGTLAGLAKRALKGIEIVALKTPDDLPAARDLLTRHAGRDNA